MMYSLDDYFGVTGSQLQAADRASSSSPSYTAAAGMTPTGSPANGVIGSFTDWRRSPVFWLAAFALFALGTIHLEGNVKLALK